MYGSKGRRGEEEEGELLHLYAQERVLYRCKNDLRRHAHTLSGDAGGGTSTPASISAPQAPATAKEGPARSHPLVSCRSAG